MDRAQRRFYKEKWKAKVKNHWIFRFYYTGGEAREEPTDTEIGITSITRARCSNYCCGNPRKFYPSESLTIQEKRQKDSFKEQLKDKDK